MLTRARPPQSCEPYGKIFLNGQTVVRDTTSTSRFRIFKDDGLGMSKKELKDLKKHGMSRQTRDSRRIPRSYRIKGCHACLFPCHGRLGPARPAPGWWSKQSQCG